MNEAEKLKKEQTFIWVTGSKVYISDDIVT